MVFSKNGFWSLLKKKRSIPFAVRVLLFVISLGTAPQGLAQEDPTWQDPIDADRPDMANSAEALAPGIFQWESGINWVSGPTAPAFSLPLVLRYGIVENLELQLNTQGPLWTDQSGPTETWSSLQNLGAGTKWTIYRREGKPLE